MSKKIERRARRLTGKSPEDQLDELNAELRNEPNAFRRAIESDLEAKSKRKRSAEPSVSASFKTRGD